MAVTSAMRKSSRWANAGIASILGASPDTLAVLGSLERPPMNHSSNRDALSATADGVAASQSGSDSLSDADPLLSYGSEAMPSPTESDQGSAASDTNSNTEPPVRQTLSSASSTYRAESTISTNSPETQLILGFSAIRAAIASQELNSFSILVITKPFLEVVKSPLVSGNITSLALSSLEKFLSLGVLRLDAVDAAKCANEVAYALTHCRFEATDRQEDDAVLLQLMALLEKLVMSPFGQILSGKAVHEMVETCLSMVKQMKRRDTLRRSVVAVLMSLTRTLYDPDRSYGNRAELQAARTTVVTILVDTLDPNKHSHNNGIRSTVLAVLTLCFEVSGEKLTDGMATPQINEVIGRLWKHLAQLIRVTHSPKLVHEALQLVGTIMNTNPKPYKTQFEFILVYLLTSLTPLSDLPRDDSTDDMFYAGVPNRAKSVKSAPIEPGSSVLSIPTAALQRTPEVREVMVEALVSFAVASPTLFSDLFVTYDCDKASPDLCEDLIGFLCRNAYPDSANWSTSSVPPLCLEAVLSGLNSWVELMSSSKSAATTNSAAKERLKRKLSDRKGKAVESSVAETFNKSPSKGIAAMYANNLVTKDDPKDLARFFHSCQRINKAVLGKYFSKSENHEVLENYVNAFDFSNKRIDESLRVLLCSFRLPGESAQIENLLQKFADHYIASGDKVEKTSDSAFILAYAVLMLNTDHFSPTVKRRMNYEAFKKNVQGVNKELPDDYVQAIFDGITSQEIIMPEEHDTDETFDYTWRETVVAKEKQSEPFEATIIDHEVVAEIFEINWRPMVSTLSFVFATATDDLVFRRVIAGFHQLASLASKFHAHQALTHIIASLCQISALASGDLGFPNSNIEIRIENHVSVMVSDLSTQFGDDLKAQMASITLFRILNVASPEITRNAYALVSKALVNLHLYGLGTPGLIPGMKPLPPFHTFERSKAGKPVGIFSALSSYLTSSPDTPAEPSDESVDAALGAADCIKVCDIDGTLATIVENSPEQLALGALDVVPKQSDEQYIPAKEFLLQLAAYATDSIPDIRKTVSTTALQAGLIATAIETAPDGDTASDIMDKIEQVDEEILAAILRKAPSPSVWRLLSLVEKPGKLVNAYVQNNSGSVDETSLMPMLAVLQKSDDELGSIEAVYNIAVQLRETAGTQGDLSDYVYTLGVLASYSGRAVIETRELAISYVQRELLQDNQRVSWAVAANEILMPKILEILLKPEVWKRDPQGMDLTRQQAASMLGKAFLHLTVSLKAEETAANTDAWISVLKGLDRLLSSRRQPALQEGVVEMLKNVILVTQLASQGSPEFWNRVQKELKGFLPEVAELATPKQLNANESATESVAESQPDKAVKDKMESETE